MLAHPDSLGEYQFAGLGSKMGIDATHKWAGETSRTWGRPIAMDAEVKPRIDSLWKDLGF